MKNFIQPGNLLTQPVIGRAIHLRLSLQPRALHLTIPQTTAKVPHFTHSRAKMSSPNLSETVRHVPTQQQTGNQAA